MSKKCESFGWIVAILLFGIIGFLYFNGDSSPLKNFDTNTASNTDSITGKSIFDTTSQGDRFSKSTEPHWTHLPLTYNIENTCGTFQGNRIRKGFSEFSKETGYLINFTEINGNADIMAHCFVSVPEGSVSNTYVSGEGGYASYGNEIVSGTLNFYNIDENSHSYDGGCLTYPDVEIHEILHTFGFKHITERKSIMGPLANNCYVRHIDSEILQKINEIYR